MIKKLFVRADANGIVATGHVMRCLSIADAMRTLGVETVFITADKESRYLIEPRGYRQIVLHKLWNHMEDEIALMEQIIREERIRLLLVDSYAVTEHYLKTLQQFTKIAYMDDLPNPEKIQIYPCDILINYSAYAKSFPYQDYYPDTKLLLGCDYVPLRAQFSKQSARILGEEVKEVLLMTGGSDQYHVLLKQAGTLPGLYPEIQFHAISGSYNDALSDIRVIQSRTPNLTLSVNVPNLSEYMYNADMAITAGGTTLYELSACETPSIGFTFADNQIRNVQAFDKLHAIMYAGDARDALFINRLIQCFDNIVRDYKKREVMRQNMKKLVTPGSTLRLAEALMNGD